MTLLDFIIGAVCVGVVLTIFVVVITWFDTWIKVHYRVWEQHDHETEDASTLE